MSVNKHLWPFLKLTRPIFLIGAAALYALGIAVAASQGAVIDLTRVLLGQWMITATQLMTQYANEYYDLETDRMVAGNRTLFSGGSGVLAAGELSPRTALIAARICGTAAIIAIGLAATISPLVALIGIVALLAGWFYSAPPLALMSSGWGELSASLVVAVLTPLTGFVLQTGRIDPAVFVVGLPLALIHIAMLIAFEFPDFEGDRATGKRTLAVRLGKNRAAQLHNALIVGACAALLAYSVNWDEARWTWLALPLAAWQIGGVAWRARRGWAQMQWLTVGAVALFAWTAGLWLAGFLLN